MILVLSWLNHAPVRNVKNSIHTALKDEQCLIGIDGAGAEGIANRSLKMEFALVPKR